MVTYGYEEVFFDPEGFLDPVIRVVTFTSDEEALEFMKKNSITVWWKVE